MTVNDMTVKDLKGMKAHEKKWTIENENTPSEIIDRLANDAGKEVRTLAIRDKRVSQKALYKAATSKKNWEEEWIMGSIFSKLSSENILKYFQEEHDKELKGYIIGKFSWEIKSAAKEKPELFGILIDRILSGESRETFIDIIVSSYEIKKNPKLFDWFVNENPEKLIKYRDEQKISDTEVSKLFKGYMDSGWYADPRNDLGYDFIIGLSDKDLTTLISASRVRNNDDYMTAVLDNPNLSPKHTLIMIAEMRSDRISRTDLPIIKKAPLDKKVEDHIYTQIASEIKSYGGNTTNWNWKLFEALAANPQHDKKRMLDLLENWDYENQGYSAEAIYNLLATGKYDEKDLERIEKPMSDYNKESLVSTLVQSENYPKNKLKQLWEKYWKGEWKEGEIPGPSGRGAFGSNFKSWNMSYEESKIHEIVYYLVKESALAGEFGLEYFQKHNDDTYLPDEAKDMFLF
jgi:hypothetical protein